MEKNKSATNPITCGRVNPDIFLSDDVKSVSRDNVEGEQSNFPPLSRSTAHALKTFMCRGTLGTRVNPNTIGYMYVWTGKFLYPERKSCGFKNIRIRVDGASISWTNLAHSPSHNSK